MKCKGRFVYKSLMKRDGGEFTNDKGEKIVYEPSYVIKCDDDEGNERRLKFPVTNEKLANKLRELSPYTQVIIEFDVALYSSNARLIPIDLAEEE